MDMIFVTVLMGLGDRSDKTMENEKPKSMNTRNPDRTLSNYEGGSFKGDLRANEGEMLETNETVDASSDPDEAETTSYHSENEQQEDIDFSQHEENDISEEENPEVTARQ